MAAGTIKTKAQLVTDIDSVIVAGGNIDAVGLNGILQNVVASYENIIQEYTTVQRDGLTPFEGQKIYNTTSNRLEYYSSTKWLPCSQKETVAVDCSANPNYQEALVGDQYTVTVSGKIGGASGKAVSVGDLVYCIGNNAGGDEATVGTSWKVCYSTGAQAQLKKATITIPTASVLTLNTTPINIVAALPGKAFQLVSGSIRAVYNSATYATNVNLVVRAGGSAFYQANTSIAFTASAWKSLILIHPSAGNDEQIELNNDLEVFVTSGNPTAGDSDIEVTVFYLELTF